MELLGFVQTYHWGKIGSSSLVARLAETNWQNFEEVILNCSSGHCQTSLQMELERGTTFPFKLDPKETYAEFWIGTHPNGKCIIIVLEDSIPRPKLLSQYIENENILLSNKKLPFLFKVLSVQMALSIQAHPDLTLAKKLHSTQPDIYKDPNHKPEMAVALTDFEVLCGFRTFEEILFFITNLQELSDIIGTTLIDELTRQKNKSSLKKVFTQLLSTPKNSIESKLTSLLKNLEKLSKEDQLIYEVDLIQRLSKQFPNDIGIWCVYFLQHLILKPGEAVFLPANEPHAYIFGDCVEIMAESDNVVRVGLTPKFKDVNILCEMLTYETGKDWILKPRIDTSISNVMKICYNPPNYIKEFALIKYEALKIETTYTILPLDAPTVLLCIEGNGICKLKNNESNYKMKKIIPGSCLLIPSISGTKTSGYDFTNGIEIEITSKCDKFVIFQALAQS